MLYSDDSLLNSSRAMIAAIEKSVPLFEFDDAIFAAANRFCAVIMFLLYIFTILNPSFEINNFSSAQGYAEIIALNLSGSHCNCIY